MGETWKLKSENWEKETVEEERFLEWYGGGGVSSRRKDGSGEQSGGRRWKGYLLLYEEGAWVLN